MGICEALTIIFVVCKLFGVISWSWWLVLLPEIIAFVLYFILIGAHIWLTVSIARTEKRLGFRNYRRYR